MITLGSMQKDRITGFTGVCTGLVQYISGCNQALIAPKVGKDGTMKEANWFDVQRLDQVGEKVIALDNGATPGSDNAAPVR